MDLDKKGVIVIGGHVQGLGITRIYGKNNISVILMDNTPVNLTRHSRYCRKFINYEKDGLLDALLKLADTGKFQNWLIVPTNDAHVEILSKNKELLSKYFKVSSEDQEVLDYFFNKRKTYRLAESLAIPIPKTHMPDSKKELEQLDLEYPCIIKPAVMHTFYSKTKKKVFVCNNKLELLSNYDKALEVIPEKEVIIQDIIPGNSEHQYSACFMFDGKKPLVTLTARRARQHPPDFGNATTYAETIENDFIVTNGIKLLSKVSYRGVCEVEFKYDTRDKTYKFLEVNPRTWKWHSIAEKSESPILMSLYHFMYGLATIENNIQKFATFRHLVTDIPTILKMKLTGIDYVKTKKNTKFAVWDKSDLLPVFFELLHLPYYFIKR